MECFVNASSMICKRVLRSVLSFFTIEQTRTYVNLPMKDYAILEHCSVRHERFFRRTFEHEGSMIVPANVRKIENFNSNNFVINMFWIVLVVKCPWSQKTAVMRLAKHQLVSYADRGGPSIDFSVRSNCSSVYCT